MAVPAGNSCYRTLLCHVAGHDTCETEAVTGPNSSSMGAAVPAVCESGRGLLEDKLPNKADECVHFGKPEFIKGEKKETLPQLKYKKR